MDLKDFMNSVSETKKNLIRTSDTPEFTEKEYPSYILNLMLSYHPDCILVMNELNTRGLVSHGVTNRMNYEFLLHALPKRRRYLQGLPKAPKQDDIELIQDVFSYSFDKARDLVDVLSASDIETLRKSREQGGRS